MGILAAFLALAATACTVTQKDPDYVPPAPLPALEQLKQAPLTDPATLGAGQDSLSFVTADRNIVCSLTSARGEHVNLPYEQNGFGGSGNGKFATVPVAHCELGAYPKPSAKDIRDDCAGTGLGYLGGTALLTGALVAVSGSIGFVGLILPHGVRLLVGSRHRALLPLSALAGALFLVWADTAARTLFDPRELPVGIITALVGGPVFALLLLRRRVS